MLRSSATLLAALILGSTSLCFPAQNEGIAVAAPQVAERSAFTVIGLAARTTNEVEMAGKEGKIGPLWGELLHGGADAIPGVIDQKTIYAVYTHYESDETGAYDLILGKSVQPGEKAPPNMRTVVIPAAHYLVFASADNSAEATRTAWLRVYAYFAKHADRRRAYTFDFEQHSSTSSQIFIAIREGAV